MKKLISAASALAMAASMVGAAVPFATGAADATKGYELRAFTNKAGETVSTTISEAEIAAGDVTVPIAVYYTEATADTQFIAAQWTVDSKDGDASNTNVTFTGYGPNTDYYDADQSVTLSDGSSGETNRIIGFCGTIKSNKKGTTFSDSGSQKMYSVAEKQTSWDCPNSWGSVVWATPDGGYSWSGSTSDEYPLMVFEATFKKGTPAGTYTIDFLQQSSADGKTWASYVEAGNPTTTYSAGAGNLTFKGIDIVIGDSAATPATTAAATPATTAIGATTAAAPTTTTAGENSGSGSTFTVDPNFIVSGQEYTVTPGEEITAEFILTSAGGHQVSTFDVELGDLPAGITATMDDPYCYAVDIDAEYTAQGNHWQVMLLDDKQHPLDPLEGEAVIQFTFKIPEDIAPGEYEYTFDRFDVVEYAQVTADHDISKFAATIVPGKLIVEGDAPATTTAAPTTTAAATAAATTAAATEAKTTAAATEAKTTAAATAANTTAAATGATTAAATPATTATPTGAPLYGDTNCDNKVNIADVVVLNKWLNDAKSYNMTAQGKLNADCCDEKGGEGLDKNDSDAIIRSIVHLVELPCASADLK